MVWATLNRLWLYECVNNISGPVSPPILPGLEELDPASIGQDGSDNTPKDKDQVVVMSLW
jgi:hypothetical protein